MKQSIKVKEKRIGSGKPIICVPVIKCTQSDIVSEIKSLCKKEIDMIEWRIDFFESIKDYGKIKGLLNEVEGILKGTLFLVTYRSTYQGGNGNLSENEYRNLLLYLAENKKIDFLDVECLQWNEVKKEINQIQAYGKRVIASHHNFQKTPSEEEMLLYLEEMNQSGADILKLAVMPQNNEDVLSLLKVTDIAQRRFAPKLIVTMSMGKYGMVSRILGEIYGSVITFGLNETASAPGQIPYDKLNKMLEMIHEFSKE